MKRNLQLDNLLPGDRIVVPKSNLRLVQHHVIYLGYDENGIGWFAENKIGVGVQIVSAEEFLRDITEITRIEPFRGTDEQRNNAVQYAMALEGTNYDLLQFNCEHYANIVQHNRKESSQVKSGLILGVVGIAALGIFFNND